jgi:predicted nucleic acid-binding protein
LVPFFDSNVLVYTVDRAEPEKREVARALFEEHLREGSGFLSPQVLREFYVASTRKLATPLPEQAARDAVEDLGAYCTLQESREMILSAVSRKQRLSISFWDALIVEAAILGGADHILTEDLQHGQVIEGVKVHNPFLRAYES